MHQPRYRRTGNAKGKGISGVELEICVEDIAGVAAAIAGGADRIELCSALTVGRLTPSAALADAALELAGAAGVKVHAMIRPRGGDFTYDEAELALAIAEARSLIAQGIGGLVFGAASDDRLDEVALELGWRRFARKARPFGSPCIAQLM